MAEEDLLDPSILDQLRSVSAATVSMQLIKRGILRCAMTGPAPFLSCGDQRFVGPAYTFRFLPRREDLATLESYRGPRSIRAAFDAIPSGQIVVMETRGEQKCATLGDILAARLKHRGTLAVVSDGRVRDAQEIEEVGLPIFCTGAAALPSVAEHWLADWQVPIACGGVTVIPGDIIVADRDGAVVIPRALAGEVAEGAIEQEHYETFAQKRVVAGWPLTGLYPPEAEAQAAYQKWIDEGEPEIAPFEE